MFHKMFQSFKLISVNSSVQSRCGFFVRMLPSLRAGAMTWSDLIGWSLPGPRPDLFRRASWCPPATVSGPAGPARRCAIMAAIMAVSGGAREKSISHRSPVHSSRKADRRIPASPHPHIPTSPLPVILWRTRVFVNWLICRGKLQAGLVITSPRAEFFLSFAGGGRAVGWKRMRW